MKQREIKFRVYHKGGITGRIKLNGYERVGKNGWEWMCIELNPDKGERWCQGVYPKSEKYIRIEYIGLKDKNGKEVFEGDILGDDNHEIEFTLGDTDRMIVEWHSEFARFGLSFYSVYGGEGYTGHTQNIHDYINNGCYVIGNIYENPELLK